MSLLKKSQTASLSPPHTVLRAATEQSPESAQIFELVCQKYHDSIEQMLDTAKTFFLTEFQEILFDEEKPRVIEEKLASEPGLLISLFQQMKEHGRRKRNSIKNRVTFSNVEEIQYASGSIGNNSQDSGPIELSADIANNSEDNFI